MTVYKMPVKAPMSHPFSFPLPPEMNPPMNRAKKVMTVVTIFKDAS